MTNEEHVNRLKQGVEVWNTWRQANPDRPDLSKAILREVDLSGANLNRAALIWTNLCRANLTKATLRGADLTGA